MDSPARKRLQITFKEVAIGKKFQMANAAMGAAIPGSQVFTKTDELKADDKYTIRPDWPVEVIDG